MSNTSKTYVAILAGGLGTRLKPILPGRQKVVARVVEHPFLEYILDQLDKSGFKNVVICTGHLGDQVKEAFGDNYHHLSLFYSREPSPLGTAGAINLALPYLKSEHILIMNGDSFYDIDLNFFWLFHLEKKANGTILLKELSNTARYGNVEVDKDSRIIKFQEKKTNGGAGLISGGIYLLKRSMLLEIPENSLISFEKDIFPKWIGNKFYGFKGNGRFIDIGTPETYKKAKKFFSQYPL